MVQALAPLAKFIISIEADEKLHEVAKQRLHKTTNALLLFGPSEKALPGILSGLSGEIVFWLDGHYSGQGTYRGASDSPVHAELCAIAKHMPRWRRTSILIDDARCFDGRNGYLDIPWITEWAESHDLKLSFANDVIVMQSHA